MTQSRSGPGPAVIDYGAKPPGLRLHRMPLVWLAVGVPGLFLVWLVLLSPSL